MRSYDERLWTPWNWWLVGGFAVLSAWLAFEVAGGLWPWAGSLIALGTTTGALLEYGAVRVSVGAHGLQAGKATLPPTAVGDVCTLTPEEAARLRGPDYDPRAYHLIRGYIRAAIRVEVDDPADPTPYWYVATRHPDQLAAELAKSLRR